MLDGTHGLVSESRPMWYSLGGCDEVSVTAAARDTCLLGIWFQLFKWLQFETLHINSKP